MVINVIQYRVFLRQVLMYSDSMFVSIATVCIKKFMIDRMIFDYVLCIIAYINILSKLSKLTTASQFSSFICCIIFTGSCRMHS